jgi:hypothetical protein
MRRALSLSGDRPALTGMRDPLPIRVATRRRIRLMRQRRVPI